MQNATEMIDERGGTVKVALALDLTPSTVSSWRKAKGGIPRWWLPRVEQLPIVQSATSENAA